MSLLEERRQLYNEPPMFWCRGDYNITADVIEMGPKYRERQSLQR